MSHDILRHKGPSATEALPKSTDRPMVVTRVCSQWVTAAPRSPFFFLDLSSLVMAALALRWSFRKAVVVSAAKAAPGISRGTYRTMRMPRWRHELSQPL